MLKNQNVTGTDRQLLIQLLGQIPEEKFRNMTLEEIVYLVYDATYLKYFGLWKLEEENARSSEQGTIRLTQENLKLNKVLTNVVYCLENYETVEEKIRGTILKEAKKYTTGEDSPEEDNEGSDFDTEC